MDINNIVDNLLGSGKKSEISKEIIMEAIPLSNFSDEYNDDEIIEEETFEKEVTPKGSVTIETKSAKKEKDFVTIQRQRNTSKRRL